MSEALRRFLHATLNLLLPHQCALCAQPTNGGKSLDSGSFSTQGLCGRCVLALTWCGPSVCQMCGATAPVLMSGDYSCAACEQKESFLSGIRFLWRYNSVSRPIVMRLKHQQDFSFLPVIRSCADLYPKDWIKDVDWVTPVPLHWTRLFMRGYNQSALIARELIHRHPHLYAPGLLKRLRRTPSQGKKSKTERLENVKNAFAPSDPQKIKNKNIVLVDDVCASGATLEACGKALKKAGASKVTALTLARSF